MTEAYSYGAVRNGLSQSSLGGLAIIGRGRFPSKRFHVLLCTATILVTRVGQAVSDDVFSGVQPQRCKLFANHDPSSTSRNATTHIQMNGTSHIASSSSESTGRLQIVDEQKQFTFVPVDSTPRTST